MRRYWLLPLVGLLLMAETGACPPERILLRDQLPVQAIREAARTPFPHRGVCTAEELQMIEAVVMHEVGYCSRESKVALANVILNRLRDGRFGGSVSEILHSRRQFSAISNYYDQRLPPDEECRAAVLAAFAGEDCSRGALYYCNPDFVGDEATRRWFDTLELLFELDGQRFYR